MSAAADIRLGLVDDLSNEDYHAIDALGSSGLKKLARSPEHFFGQVLDPARPVSDPTPAMKAGTLAHCAILEPLTLAERYVVRPEGQKSTTKDGIAWTAAQPAGVEIVTADQMRTAVRQAKAVRRDPEIAALLAVGQPEVSAFWIDPDTGVLCKCRPDWVSLASEKAVVLLDVKTAQDAGPEGFSRAVWNFRYDLSAAHYSDGFERASGLMVMGFVLVVVEAEYPHACASYLLTDRAMAQARADVRRLTNLYAECKAGSAWPGYLPGIQPIDLPRWSQVAA